MNALESQASQFREELDRILNSEALRPSEALRRLLGYLGEKALAPEPAALKEFTIGVEVFHKPADYNPQEDPTVRVLASKLRHKLEDYYQSEGVDHPVRIELPKGHYALKFQPRPPGATGAGAAPATRQVRRWRLAAGALGVALALVTALAVHWGATLRRGPAYTSQGTQIWTPELELIWRPYLESDRHILIALGAPLFTKFSKGFFRDPRLNQWEEAEGSERLRLLQKALESPYASPWYNFTGIGEASGGFLLCRLLLARKPDLLLKRSTAFSWEDLGTHNAIFLGSPKFNPHLKDLPFEQDFVIEGGGLKNLRPQLGEPSEFPEVWTQSHAALMEDHALVTRLPGLHGQGEITILAGSSTEGTWAATEFVTSPAPARELVAKLQAAGGRLPEAYQVVVRAKIKDGVPIEVSYVTHRVLKPTAGSAKR